MDISKHERYAVILAALLIAVCFVLSRLVPDGMTTNHLRCAIEINRENGTSGSLLTGYNYFLLNEFASDNGKSLDIVLSRNGDNYVDSLKTGAVDIVAVPFSDGLVIDSIETSIPIDSSSLWLMAKKNVRDIRILNKWIDGYHHSDNYPAIRERFLNAYDPIRKARSGQKMDYLSPYDGIIRQYADSLGWDWKLLTAVIYQESRFRIDAISHRGAIGLMQMMPYTAEKWCDGNIIDPEQNIKAGTRYLKYLSGLYIRVTKDRSERQKYVLAAYNAGEGRVKDVISYSRVNGIGTEYWDSVATVIPSMRDSVLMAATDTVKMGAFNGEGTVNYVRQVLNLKKAFDTIYTEEQ